MTQVRFDGKRAYLLLEEEYEKLIEKSGEKLMGRKEIAELWGVTLSTLSKRPWLLPDYGRDCFRKRDKKWLATDVLLWVRNDPQKLKDEYKCLS